MDDRKSIDVDIDEKLGPNPLEDILLRLRKHAACLQPVAQLFKQ